MMIGKKILVTGSKGLGKNLAEILCKNNSVHCVDRSSGFDIADVCHWGQKFLDYDIVINNAYDGWGQTQVLEFFSQCWNDQPNRMIINIGSMVTDHARTEKTKDHEYWPYRQHKLALQQAFQKLCRCSACDIKLINPGPFYSEMSQHIDCDKMDPIWLAERIAWIMQQPEIKRVDLWK